MYCPQCGKANSAEQKFCRSRGLSLEKVVQSLVEQLPGTDTDIDTSLRERQRKVELWAKILGTGVISIAMLAVVGGIVYTTIIVEGDVLEGLGVLAFILAAVAFTLLMIYREFLLKASKRTLPKPASSFPPPETAKLLPEPSFEPIPSVTERTTDLLAIERKERRE